jgi:hypothetical protein
MAKLTQYTSDDEIAYGTIRLHEEDSRVKLLEGPPTEDQVGRLEEIAPELSNLYVEDQGNIVAAVHFATIMEWPIVDDLPEEGPYFHLLLGLRANQQGYLDELEAVINEFISANGASELTVQKELKGGRFEFGKRDTNGHP